MLTLLALIIAYLIGSISFSLIVMHYAQLPDLRSQGLGTLSSENVLAVCGKEKAVITLLLDGVKGFIAIWIAKILGVTGFMLGITLLVTVIGHLFPLYYNFRGGNGIAAVMGGTLLLSFWVGVILIIIWFAVTIVTRYIYLSTLLVVALLPIFLLFFGHFNYFIPTVLIAALIFWHNFEHVDRLRKGIETRASW